MYGHTNEYIHIICIISSEFIYMIFFYNLRSVTTGKRKGIILETDMIIQVLNINKIFF